ncbi:MAG TPA: GAF domain-containing protein, partial [Aggregatilineales bacterium]|nr:GAF domain-containing protein [Aggregatilineales bacterium]
MDNFGLLPDLHASRILVVEDDFEVADRLVAVLRGAGYYVQNAYNVGDALAVDHARFDLAVVDGQMRDREGVTLLQRISKHAGFSRLQILIVGDASDELSPGRRETLQRHFTDSELCDSVRKVLDRSTNVSTRLLDNQGDMETQIPTGGDPRPKLLTEDDIPTESNRIGFDSLLQQQLAELRILSNLGRSISSVLELSEVLNQIVEAATTLTRAEEGLLLLPDPVGKALYLRAMKGLDDQNARNFRIKTEDPLIGRVFRSGEPILRGQHGPQRVKTEYFVQSLLYVPLTFKEQVIGVLGVNNRQTDRPFSQHDQELLLDLAAHAAIAIENAQLYEERLLQNRQLSLLVSAGKTLSSTLSLSEVLTILCQQMIQTVGVNECTISRHDEQTNDLLPLAAARYMIWAATGAPQKSVDAFKIGAETPDGKESYIFRHSLDRRLNAEERPYDPFWANHSLVLPIHGSAPTAIGVLELHYPHAAPNPSQELERPVRTLVGEIMMLTGSTSLQPSGTLLTLLQNILERSGAPWLSFYLRANPQTFFKVFEYGSVSFVDDPPLEQQPVLRAVKDYARKTLIDYSVHDPTLPAEVRDVMTQAGVESLLSIRLMIKGKPFAAVTLSHLQPGRRFRPNEISLASALVTQAASAIENARLFSDLSDSLLELKQTQATLVQAARLSTMGELAAVVAHQINNPLTTILADAEIILQDIGEHDPMREGL